MTLAKRASLFSFLSTISGRPITFSGTFRISEFAGIRHSKFCTSPIYLKPFISSRLEDGRFGKFHFRMIYENLQIFLIKIFSRKNCTPIFFLILTAESPTKNLSYKGTITNLNICLVSPLSLFHQ